MDECSNILSNIAVELFAESNPENFSKEKREKSKPLGLLAQTWLMEILCIEPDINLTTDILTNPGYVPHLAIYGQIEEEYLD